MDSDQQSTLFHALSLSKVVAYHRRGIGSDALDFVAHLLRKGNKTMGKHGSRRAGLELPLTERNQRRTLAERERKIAHAEHWTKTPQAIDGSLE